MESKSNIRGGQCRFVQREWHTPTRYEHNRRSMFSKIMFFMWQVADFVQQCSTFVQHCSTCWTNVELMLNIVEHCWTNVEHCWTNSLYVSYDFSKSAHKLLLILPSAMCLSMNNTPLLVAFVRFASNVSCHWFCVWFNIVEQMLNKCWTLLNKCWTMLNKCWTMLNKCWTLLNNVEQRHRGYGKQV